MTRAHPVRLTARARTGTVSGVRTRRSLLAVWLLCPAALACAPEGDTAAAHAAPLVGADNSALCAWSSAALLAEGESLCSGVLIHPRVVAYAGHCGTDFTVARFGTGAVRRAVNIDRCAAHPDCGDVCSGGSFVAGDPWDYGVCVLEAPATGAVPTPPMMGCELDALVDDVRGTVVGFGRDDADMAGLKNELVMRLSGRNARRNEVVWSGLAAGQGLCAGDSGGPTYLALPDSTWRVVAVHHGRDDPCGRAFDRLLSAAIPWIERETGFDVTPCHDADGTWAPTAACRGFPTDPGGDHGSYPDCTSGPVDSSRGASCGPPWAPPTDGGAPLDASSPAADGGGDEGGDGSVPGGPPAPVEGGCRAGTAASPLPPFLAFLVALATRRRRRTER